MIWEDGWRTTALQIENLRRNLLFFSLADTRTEVTDGGGTKHEMCVLVNDDQQTTKMDNQSQYA
jgi:hypothetical protein